jgi:hypothetical protein
VVVGGDHLGDGGEVADWGGIEGCSQGLLEGLAVAGRVVAGQCDAQLVVRVLIKAALARFS